MSFPTNEKVSVRVFADIPFDNKYEHHPFLTGGMFKKQTISVQLSTMQDFLGMIYDNGDDVPYFRYWELGNGDGFNFNFGNGLITTFDAEVPQGASSGNYMKVTGKTTGEIKYYFITSVVQLNASDNYIVCRFNLELDVIATYGKYLLDMKQSVSTSRKHCQRYALNSNSFYCSDVMLNEPELEQFTPSRVVSNEKFIPKTQDSVMWLYYAVVGSSRVEIPSIISNANSCINELYVPYQVRCFPLVNKITYKVSGTFQYEVNIHELLNELWDNPDLIGIKVSPYSPFGTLNHLYDNNVLSSFTFAYYPNTHDIWCTYENPALDGEQYDDGNIIYDCIGFKGNWDSAGQKYDFLVNKLCNCEHDTANALTCFQLLPKPTASSLRSYLYECKLYNAPFRKYVLKTMGCEGVEIFPATWFANKPYTTPIDNKFTIKMCGISTQIPVDQVVSYYAKPDMGSASGTNFYYVKSVNATYSPSLKYSYPQSKDAYETFMATQNQSFQTSKVAQGVTGALSVAGGVGMILAQNYVAGALMIAGGVTAVGTAIQSSASKIEDLKNTPDSMTNYGNSIYHDNSYISLFDKEAITFSLQGSLVIYELNYAEKEMVLDYFFNYGYNVSRNCYFNSELYPSDYTTTGWIDQRLFTRQTFNFIKLNEDISSKIHTGDIEPVCKSKLASIFMKGIKLYTLLPLDQRLYENTAINNFYDYYENEIYENAEVY